MVRFAELMRAGSLCLGLAALAAPALAEDLEPLPNLDPLDPVSCDHEKGYVVIAIAWVNAWYAGEQSGKIEEPRATELAVWFVAMENYLLESNDVKGACLALIQVRLDHKF